MGLIDIWNVYRATGALLAKFGGACVKAATDIANEDPGTDNHTNRLVWAEAIMAGGAETKAREMLRYAAATNATLQANGDDTSDNDVQYIVNSQIDTLAVGG